MFSSRLPKTLSTNAFSRAIARHQQNKTPLLDLTCTNPTSVGLPYPDDLLTTLADPAGLRYDPAPLGVPIAREAVARTYAARGVETNADQIVLTASTSEAYALLFKLLCDPGDTVLVPQPSYPLFELLTDLEDVRAVPYRLEYHTAWSIDRATIESACTKQTRAILVVAPNNPTGSMLRAADREWLSTFCSEHDLAIVADEVFADYPLAPRADASTLAGEHRTLTFSLGGLSKSVGLPQLKLGWIRVGGPDARARQALERLELMCDTYLSVSTPVQLAAPRLLDAGRAIREAIAARLRDSLHALRRQVAGYPSVTLLEPEGGWSAVLQVPATSSEETLITRLLDDAHVIVHPGYFFDFPREAFLVVSLLPEPSIFNTAIERMLRVAAGARP